MKLWLLPTHIASKNRLEYPFYNWHDPINDEKLADMFDPADKSKLQSAVNNTISWLDASLEALKEQYGLKQKRAGGYCKVSFLIMSFNYLCSICYSPIMQKLYGAAGGQ